MKKGEFGGATSPEQRSLAAAYTDLVLEAEEGGTSMKVKNNTDAPQLHVNWKHLCLVVLHFAVFVFSAFSQDFTTQVAARALPQALQEATFSLGHS